MRMTLLVVPPVIPQLHDELHMSETQVGLLIGLPLAMLAVAAIPGSLLIARVGATLAVTLGMTIDAATREHCTTTQGQRTAIDGREKDHQSATKSNIHLLLEHYRAVGPIPASALPRSSPVCFAQRSITRSWLG